jgi:putative flippase GtrA
MTLMPPRIAAALWRIVPAPLESKLRSTVVKRFIRFAPAAICAVAATQITYIVCLGLLNLTAGISGFAGWLAGATVSYVISRWAWERKGRPHLLKETLPFVAVSISAGIILTLASKLGNQVAASMGLTDGVGQVIVADLFYFAANCLTFALRFVIFHYDLFADRTSTVDALAVVEGRAPVVATQAANEQPAGAPSDRPVAPGAEPSGGRHSARHRPAGPRQQPAPVDPADAARFAEAMGSARVNGVSAWANGSAHRTHSRGGERDENVFPEPGTRH